MGKLFEWVRHCACTLLFSSCPNVRTQLAQGCLPMYSTEFLLPLLPRVHLCNQTSWRSPWVKGRHTPHCGVGLWTAARCAVEPRIGCYRRTGRDVGCSCGSSHHDGVCTSGPTGSQYSDSAMKNNTNINLFDLYIIILIFNLYLALFHTRRAPKALYIITPWSLGLKSFRKPSQLPWEYTSLAQQICATQLNQSQEPSLPSRSQVPINHGWREAIIVKCLAQGHKCHDRDSNPHSAEHNHLSLNSMLLSARPQHPSA